jgi:uncharacterized membrane protein
MENARFKYDNFILKFVYLILWIILNLKVFVSMNLKE